MKKPLLILGAVASICATSAFADIVISQDQDSSDVVVTVARAAKAGKRGVSQIAAPKPMAQTGVMDIFKVQQGTVAIACPKVCEPICDIHGSQVECSCWTKGSDPKRPCTERVETSDDTVGF